MSHFIEVAALYARAAREGRAVLFAGRSIISFSWPSPLRYPPPAMRRIHVDIVPATTRVPPAEIRRCVSALRKQVHRDFAPVWGITADVHYVPRGHKPHRGAWQLVLLDERSPDDGYHELTRDGAPLGRVFMKEASKCSSGWTTTASHELLELLMNPDTTLGVMVEDESLGQRLYSYEVCDACQDDRFTYAIDGVPVSDFVHPAWFEPWRAPRSARFDQSRKLTRPFEVPKGCYAEFFDTRRRKWLTNWGGNVTPRLNVYGVNDRGGSRLSLRTKPRRAWKASDV